MTASDPSAVPPPQIQVWISGWIIECGDLAEPVAGGILHDLGVWGDPHYSGSRQALTRATGIVRWTRFDPQNHLIEALLELDGYAILTQSPGTAHTPLPAIGSRVDFAGYLFGIPPYEYAYEFEDPELPDVRMDWRVLAVRWYSVGDGVLVDLEPVQLENPDIVGGQK